MTPPAATAAARLGGVSSPVRDRRPAPARERRQSDAGRLRRERTAAPRIARRVSGPAVAARPVEADSGLRTRSVPRAESDHVALGILTSGRIWIAAFAVALAGLVFLQGELRSMNSAIGTSVQSITKLQRDNAVLRSEISSLTSDQRIYAEARRMGFVEPPVGSSRYLTSDPGSSGRALASMTAPTTPVTTMADADTSTDGGSSGPYPSGDAGSVDSSTSDSGVPSTTAAVPDTGAADGSGG